jgi:DNA-directed RNA polymerase subunit RPC12/RpoP
MILPMFYFCNNCSSQFGTPMVDTKTDKIYCPYCGSKQIEKR